jgi:Protein of unknown function (DUF2865)
LIVFARTRITIAGLGLATFAGVLVVPVPDASAQGLFGSIFGNLGINPRPPARTYAPAYAPHGHDDRFASPDFGDRRPSQAVHGAGSAYCVRLCDGKYFPLPKAASSGQVSPVKVCSALCPRAATKVFNGSDPARAVASDGTRYDDLDNAFVYREKVVPDCTCTGNGPGGLAQIDIESDPTLRAGDVVVRPTGLHVFNGSGKYPYRTADFTPVGSYARVSADLRQKLTDLKVDETATPATPVQSLATATVNEGQAETKPKPRRTRVQAVIDTGGAWRQPSNSWGNNSWGSNTRGNSWDSFWR